MVREYPSSWLKKSTTSTWWPVRGRLSTDFRLGMDVATPLMNHLKGIKHEYEHQRKRTELTPVDGVEERDEDHDGIAAEGFCRSAGIVMHMRTRQ